ncbi:hypothetical protein RSSM_03042 [Rhodopirellula sallentina SM41]|uniref:Uncharacterized protein n=1 Tax=Rhodopirellula sallentina SM41 TaxID=1263870 RepID=M5U229_9BACT|nr:hypothetical protein RSSM_03042 [Rhodopirellula sallentina SM41]
MCRYAIKGPYKIHFACLDCRKAFKQPSIGDWLRVRGKGFAFDELKHCRWNAKLLAEREAQLGHCLAELESEYRTANFNCPDCGEPMADLGRDFKAPRKSDSRSWSTLREILTLGHVFNTCGCDGPGFIPSNRTQFRQYLDERLADFNRHLQYYQSRTDGDDPSNADACRYWRSRIDAVLAAQSADGG